MCSFIVEPQIYEHFFKKLILKPYKRSTCLVRQGIRAFDPHVYKRYNSKLIFLYGAEVYILRCVVQNIAQMEPSQKKTKKNFIFLFLKEKN